MRQKLTGEKRKKVIDKIQKLFNRAERSVVDADDAESVDHEAQLALETARRLMLQYGLEAHDVETVSVGDAGTADADGVTVQLSITNPGPWVKSLAVTIADYFCVKVVYTRSPNDAFHQAAFIYYGITIGAHSAAYAFESCFNQIRTLSRRYKVKRELWEWHPFQFKFRTWERYRDLAKEEYRKGIVAGFYQNLMRIKKSESPAETALSVCYDKVADDFIKDKVTIVKEETPRTEAAYTAGGHYGKGYNDADKVSIVQGIGTNPKGIAEKGESNGK